MNEKWPPSNKALLYSLLLQSLKLHPSTKHWTMGMTAGLWLQKESKDDEIVRWASCNLSLVFSSLTNLIIGFGSLEAQMLDNNDVFSIKLLISHLLSAYALTLKDLFKKLWKFPCPKRIKFRLWELNPYMLQLWIQFMVATPRIYNIPRVSLTLKIVGSGGLTRETSRGGHKLARTLKKPYLPQRYGQASKKMPMDQSLWCFFWHNIVWFAL